MSKRKTPRGKSKDGTESAEFILAESFSLSGARAWIAPTVAFASLFVLYLVTLAPSVVGGDSGELTTASLTGGVPHPPGYPIFAILARLFAALPLGHSPAWRVNLLSATSTAAAGGLGCALVQKWARSVPAGLVAAALFGTDSVVWLHATSAEVFGLNAMFVALAFLLWLCVERTRARRFVFGLTLVSGLAMCNHHTFVFVGAPLVLRSFWVARRNLGMGGVALALGLGLLGLLPYAYLMAASGSSAAVSWGDQTTLDGLLGHILRRDYGTFSMGRANKDSAFIDEGTFFPTLWLMGGHAFPRLLWIGPPLALSGFYLDTKDRQTRQPLYVLVAVLCIYVFAFCALSNLSTSNALYLTILSRFCIQSDLMLAIAAGLGFARIFTMARSRWRFVERHARWTLVGAILILAVGVTAHASDANERHNQVFPDFVTTAFASLPANAIVITMGDHLTGAVFYFREVEKLRPDIIHLDRELLGCAWYGERKRRLYPDLFLPEGLYGRRGWNIKKLLDGNPGRPLVVIDRLDPWDQSWKDGYKLATNGLVHPVVPASQFPTFEEWQERDRKAIGNYSVVPALRAPDGSWEYALGQLVMATQGGRAHLALVYSNEHDNIPAPARMSVNLLEDIVAKAGGEGRLGIPGYPGMRKLVIGPTVWKDLGIGYEILGRVDASFYPRVALAYEKFVERAEPNDPDVPAARNYVEQHQPPAGLLRR